MLALDQLLQAPLVLFSLVLSRVGGLVMTAPLFGSTETPLQVRAFLAVAMALVLTPTQWGRPVEMPADLAGYGVLIAVETLLGMILGLGVMILLSGIQLAGQIISQISGMSLADVFNPGFDSEVPLISHLLYLVTMSVYVLLGGHRILVDALLRTFATLPLGQAALPSSLGEMLVALLSESFSLGLRAAAPAAVALLLATILLGLISRTLPQLNVLVVGFGINSLVTLAMLAMTVGGMAWLFQESLADTLPDLANRFELRQPAGVTPVSPGAP